MIQVSPVFIIMAINAEVLPVTPVGRVVFVVVVFVVDGKHPQILMGNLSATAGTYPGMDSQGLLAVTFQAVLPGLTGLCHNPIHFFLV
jgi:hypothetical protein